jgi:hypothetical protein
MRGETEGAREREVTERNQKLEPSRRRVQPCLTASAGREAKLLTLNMEH